MVKGLRFFLGPTPGGRVGEYQNRWVAHGCEAKLMTHGHIVAILSPGLALGSPKPSVAGHVVLGGPWQ